MRDRGKVWALAGAAMALALSMPVVGEEKGDEKPREPFFHQFLIPGDPLDEKLLEQEKRVEENPNSAALRNDFGNLLAERRFPKEARAEYKKALQLDPQFFLAAYNLGMMEETEGRIARAISAYREAIERRRGFPPAHFRLGRLYEKQGRDQEAIQAYAKAIRIDASMRDPRQNPLVVDSRLIDRASLVNYSRDLARAAQRRDAGYVDIARFRPVPVDRPLDTDELVEEAGPQTIDSRQTAPPAGIRAPPMPTPARPGRSGRREAVPRPAEPPPPVEPMLVPPEPAEPVPAPEPEPEG